MCTRCAPDVHPMCTRCARDVHAMCTRCNIYDMPARRSASGWRRRRPRGTTRPARASAARRLSTCRSRARAARRAAHGTARAWVASRRSFQLRRATPGSRRRSGSKEVQSASLGKHQMRHRSRGPALAIQAARVLLLSGPEGGPRQAGGLLVRWVAAWAAAASQGHFGHAAQQKCSAGRVRRCRGRGAPPPA